MSRIYFDHNATTPVAPEVLEAMLPALRDNFGNPSSMHFWGRNARFTMDSSREKFAGLLGVKSSEVVFTSGGTESNNAAILGAARKFRNRGRHIITSSIEHHAVLHACQYLERQENFVVTYLPVDRFGRVDVTDLLQALRPDTILVSIMSANNETGARQPVRQMGMICRERGVLFHCDAVQSFGKMPVTIADFNADLVSICAHKFYGPKGVGALYIRSQLKIEPLLIGGAHENEKRAGTENVAGVLGMVKAAELFWPEAKDENERLMKLTEKLWDGIQRNVPDVVRNGHPAMRLGNTLNVSFSGGDSESLIANLDLEGIAVSSGSACAVGSIESSHVLKAMNLPAEVADAAVRFSLGRGSTEAEVDTVIRKIPAIVERMRKARRATK